MRFCCGDRDHADRVRNWCLFRLDFTGFGVDYPEAFYQAVDELDREIPYPESLFTEWTDFGTLPIVVTKKRVREHEPG